MENVSWKDHKTFEYLLYIVKEKRKILNTVLEGRNDGLGKF